MSYKQEHYLAGILLNAHRTYNPSIILVNGWYQRFTFPQDFGWIMIPPDPNLTLPASPFKSISIDLLPLELNVHSRDLTLSSENITFYHCASVLMIYSLLETRLQVFFKIVFKLWREDQSLSQSQKFGRFYCIPQLCTFRMTPLGGMRPRRRNATLRCSGAVFVQSEEECFTSNLSTSNECQRNWC